MSKINILKVIAAFAFLSATTTGMAGLISEVNLVFVNLDGEDGIKAASAIKSMVDSASPMCWRSEFAYVYIQKRPNGLTNDLVGEALIEKSRPRMRQVSNILLNYKDKDVRGFDGVIAYVAKPTPQMISMSAGKLVIKNRLIKKEGDIVSAFCLVKPPVVRRP